MSIVTFVRMDPNASFYIFTLPLLTGGELPFQSLKGRKVLLVNVASECGFTPQYRQLQELHEHASDRLAIIGLPCNDFGSQEPGTAEEIRTFCDQRYQITFPLTAKVRITSDPIHPLYQWLTQKARNGVRDYPVNWNFTKFLISEEGQWLDAFAPAVSPFADEILDQINANMSS